MIIIENAKSITGQPVNLTLPSSQEIRIDASRLTIFPGLIDPHVHFRTP
jgi:dihydroorotase